MGVKKPDDEFRRSSLKDIVSAEAIEECDSDLEASRQFPTVELSAQAEVCSIASDLDRDSSLIDDDEQSSREPLVEASAVAIPLGSVLSPREELETVGAGGNSHLGPRRAEFLSAVLIKEFANVELGLSFKALQNGIGVVVSRIKPTGLVAKAKAPLRVGDKVVSVNTYSCETMEHHYASKILRESVGIVTLVVQNIGGDPHLVETMIAKPSPSCQSGIGFASSEMQGRPNLRVSHVFPEGLFAQSLLTVGDDVESINAINCSQLDAASAADIVRSSPQYVTIIARKLEGNAMVVASSDDPGLKQQSLPVMKGKVELGCQILTCVLFLVILLILVLYIEYWS